MQAIFISKEEWDQLISICQYLYANHIDILKEDTHVSKTLLDNDVLIRKGTALGYKGRTIKNVEREGKKIKAYKISDKQLETLTSRFSTIKKRRAEKEEKLNTVEQKYYDLAFDLRNNFLKKNYIENRINSAKTVQGIELFKETKWYIYERHSKSIDRKLLLFKSKVENGQIEIAISVAEGKNKFSGFGHCDNSNELLFLNTTLPGGLSPNNYIICIDKKSSDMNLLLGHTSYLSDTKKNLVTRNVVMQYVDPIYESTPAKFTVHVNTPIDISIFKFLRDENRNILSTPPSIMISTLESFRNWQENCETNRRRLFNNKIIGDYILYHKNNILEKKTQKSYLKIYEDPEAKIMCSIYFKLENENFEGSFGEPFFSKVSNSVFVSLEVYNLMSHKDIKNEKKSLYYLILNLPPANSDCNILTGIISGLTSNQDGSFATLVVAVKEKVIKTETKEQSGATHTHYKYIKDEFEEKTIETFFEAFGYQSHVIPPKNVINDLSNLLSSCEEGNAIKRKLFNEIKKENKHM